MIIKIQDQDLLLLVAHVYPNYPGVFPPPPSLSFLSSLHSREDLKCRKVGSEIFERMDTGETG